MSTKPIVIIGGGLAGLACARQLLAADKRVVIVEASGRLGGRLGSDREGGFIFDHGFQTLLDGYSEVRRHLNLERLNLRAFDPECMVWRRGRWRRLRYPLRSNRITSFITALGPLATMGDWRNARKQCYALAEAPEDSFWLHRDKTIGEYLAECGFSLESIDRVFRALCSAMFYERDLSTSATALLTALRAFTRGQAALPEYGAQSIVDQLVRSLPEETARLNTRVISSTSESVQLQSGQTLEAERVVVATDFSAAGQLIDEPLIRDWRATATIYYAADRAPSVSKGIFLNADGDGLINHMTIPSNVSPSYAPEGQALIAAHTIGLPVFDDEGLDRRAREQLVSWFGDEASEWRQLKVVRTPYALPSQTPDSLPLGRGARVLPDGRVVCGDYMELVSINGALRSGRLAAKAALDSAVHSS